MKKEIEQKIQAWVNDQLDLYNYAKQIDDSEGQQSIVEALSLKNEYMRSLIAEASKGKLWEQFDRINRSLLQLFEELRVYTANKNHAEVIREKMWELKQQRLAIIKQLKDHCCVA